MTDKDPLPKTTFQSFSEAFADQDRGGRFKPETATHVIGSTPIPKYPGAGQEDVVGPEPALGIAVGDHPEPVGTFQEIQKSIERLKPEDDPEAAA
jgi:hypothetical protein